MRCLTLLRDKLGIVADNSTEMMQKIVHYRIMVNAVGVIALAFLVLLCTIAAVWGHKVCEKRSFLHLSGCHLYSGYYHRAICVGLCVLLMAANLIGWIMFP